MTRGPAASAITLGQALSSSTLTGGTHSVPGTFVFTTPSFVPLATGLYTASVTFTPTDSANYNSVGGTVEVQVDPAPAHRHRRRHHRPDPGPDLHRFGDHAGRDGDAWAPTRS